ncbi:MAG: hypothetical protein HOL47_00995 [Chloroflexi bacterium]|nr:hypothetical protein [Chloroflexota bacterium]
MLLTTTQFVSLLGMGIALWLGIYLVTNNPKNVLSWLTSLSLWSMAGLFLNILLALNPPPIPVNSPSWLKVFLPFWRMEIISSNPNDWLQGWSVAPAAMFWHHATVLFRPGQTNTWRKIRIYLGYLVGFGMIIAQYNATILVSVESGDPLYLSTIVPGPLYALFLSLLLLFLGLSIYNLARSAKVAQTTFHKKQLEILIYSTIAAGLTGPLSLLGSGLGIQVPIVFITGLLGISMIQIGYSVAAYSAMGDARTIRRDFFYNFFTVGVAVILYASITKVIDIIFEIPSFSYILVIILAILSHSFADASRHYLDSLFYRSEVQQVRKSLRDLTRSAGEPEADKALSVALDSISASAKATFGLLLMFEGGEVKIIDQYQIEIDEDNLLLSVDDFLADDLVLLEMNHFKQPLEDAVLILPLYHEMNQIGVLVLGRPVNASQFSGLDIERLLYPVDRLADLMWGYQKEFDYINQMKKLSETSRPRKLPAIEVIKASQIEDILRKLYDYSYLGNHELSKLQMIEDNIKGTDKTHIDRGKALNQVLLMLIDKLKPESDPPRDPPPREWHSYTVLYQAYVEEVQNRDIVSKLYISEGTFNRTRRVAISSVTQMLAELGGVI